MVLPVCDDSPWTSDAIRGHTNMSTLIHIPTGHMRFVPAEKQTDEPSLELKPAKWLVELVLIASDMGREIYLDNGKIHTILSPVIRDICRLTHEETTFFPPPFYPRCTTTLRTPKCPTRSLPHASAIGMASHNGPSTPHREPGPVPASSPAYTRPALTPPPPRWNYHEWDTHQHNCYPI
jgi:hypothetical protein